jgi:hypothetical protein
MAAFEIAIQTLAMPIFPGRIRQQLAQIPRSRRGTGHVAVEAEQTSLLGLGRRLFPLVALVGVRLAK